MGVHSGKHGQINGVSTMRRWTLTDTLKHAMAVASNTLQGVARKAGVRDWSGSYTAFGASPVSMALPGQEFAFVGYGAPTNDVSGNGLRYEGNAVAKSLAIVWNWKTQEIISHTVQFEGDLELSIVTAGADPGDAVVPDVPSPGGTKIDWALNNSGSFSTLPNLTQATLTITQAVVSYVNSSTYIAGQTWTGKKSGAPLDWTLAIQQEDTDRATTVWDPGDVLDLKLFTDASLFWRLKFGLAGDFSGITVDRQTGAIIGRTLNVAMNAYYGSSAGQILLPGGTQLWP